MDLPVLDVIPALREKLLHHPVVILQAPPGAGKSTVLPLQLLDEPWLKGKIIMLEPRRLAAKSIADRMSTLVSPPENTGGTIGYRIRFETLVSPRTRIEVVTEGILVRMIQNDNSLENTSLVIFDEFHERSLHADLALAFCLQVQQVIRPDLKILIMSATLDSEHLSKLLGDAPVISSAGRQFPVEIKYSEHESKSPISKLMVQAILKSLRETAGDILAFLPGGGEIRDTDSLLQESGVPASVHQLYGDLPFRQQQEAILPRKDGGRKIVLATSIAETSLTIEGVQVVIDSGFSRLPRFDPRSGLTKLETVRVTGDAADQRAGRAGRLGPGICYRLWTSATQRNLVPRRKPEILEADLAPLMLELARWGIKDVTELTWITLPPAGAIRQAKELLTNLDAIGENGITAKGKQMQSLPTHPRIAHMLEIYAGDETTLALAIDISSLLEERDPLDKDAGADLALRLEVFRKWRKGERVNAKVNVLERIERQASHWRKLLKNKINNDAPDSHVVGKLLMAAYPERLARQQQKQGERFTLANGRVAVLPPHDPLVHESWLCVAEVDLGEKTGRIFSAAAVHEEDLYPLTRTVEVVRWDDDGERVEAIAEKRVGGLLLESKRVQGLPEEEKNRIILDMIREKGSVVLRWDDSVKMVQSRMQSLSIWRSGDGWPAVDEQNLLDSLETWLVPWLSNIYKLSDLVKLNFHDVLKSILPWPLQTQLDTLAPARLEVPSGSMIPLQYFMDGRPPVMEVRLQELFGWTETPVVNDGRMKVLLHLLSPGYKPVQVTQDLKSFWNSAYHEVRKELKVRYPKHSWPEDPWTAQPVRGAKKKFRS